MQLMGRTQARTEREKVRWSAPRERQSISACDSRSRSYRGTARGIRSSMTYTRVEPVNYSIERRHTRTVKPTAAASALAGQPRRCGVRADTAPGPQIDEHSMHVTRVANGAPFP